MDIKVKADTKKLIAAFKQLDKSQTNLAIARAINHTLAIAKTSVSKEITRVYNFRSEDVKASIFLTKATPNNNTGLVKASRYSTDLSNFKPQVFEGGQLTKRVSSFRDEDYTNKWGKTVRGKKRDVFGTKKGKSKFDGVSVEVVKGKRVQLKNPANFTNNNHIQQRGKYSSTRFVYNPGAHSTRLRSKSVFWAITGDRLNSIVDTQVSTDYANRLYHELNYLVAKAVHH